MSAHLHSPFRSTLLISGVLAGGLLIASNAQADREGWPQSFTMGTASQGGTFYIYGSGWANMVAEHLDLSGGGEVTGGPVQNLALVHSGDLAFGMTTLGPAAEAERGESPLAPGMPLNNACAMFPMYETPFSLGALSSTGINTLSDIPAGTRIGFGPAGSTADSYFPDMLETLGIDFDRRNGSWTDLAGQMQDGLIGGIGFAVGIPTPAVSQLEAQANINVLGFSEEELETILEAFPVSEFTIPASTYASLDEDLQTVSMWNFAIAGCDLPEDFVYEVTRITMENNNQMISVHRSAETSIPENVVHNTVLPFHPGAARWFNENGYEIDDDLIR